MLQLGSFRSVSRYMEGWVGEGSQEGREKLSAGRVSPYSHHSWSLTLASLQSSGHKALISSNGPSLGEGRLLKPAKLPTKGALKLSPAVWSMPSIAAGGEGLGFSFHCSGRRGPFVSCR